MYVGGIAVGMAIWASDSATETQMGLVKGKRATEWDKSRKGTINTPSYPIGPTYNVQ